MAFPQSTPEKQKTRCQFSSGGGLLKKRPVWDCDQPGCVRAPEWRWIRMLIRGQQAPAKGTIWSR
jgi:hypothetical protein